MPALQHKLAFREVLKYQLDVTMIEQPAEDVAEFELLLVLKVGEDGLLKSETRLVNRTGLLKLPPSFINPDQRTIKPSGASTEGKAALPFLPVFPETSLSVGEKWKVVESGPMDQQVEVAYELTSLQDDIAEIVSRKRLRSRDGLRSESEVLYEFSLSRGRVLLAQTVTEAEISSGRSLRTLCEYELEE